MDCMLNNLKISMDFPLVFPNEALNVEPWLRQWIYAIWFIVIEFTNNNITNFHEIPCISPVNLC